LTPDRDARSIGIAVRFRAALLAMTLVLGASGVAAASPSARLIYLRNPGAESCPDETAIRSAVAARLGYDPFFPSAPATMFAEISREKNVFRARIKLVDDQNTVRGMRELAHEGSKCEDIVDTMALSMSIAIDPESLMRKQKAKAEPEPPPAPKEAPPPRAEEPPKPPPPAPAPAIEPMTAEAPLVRAREPNHLDIGVAGGGWIGTAPDAVPSVRPFVRGSIDQISLALEGRIDGSSQQTVSQVAITTSLRGGALAGCLHSTTRAVRPKVCAVAFVGAYSAEARGIAVPRNDAELHASIGPRGGAELAITSWLLGFVDLEGQLAPMTHRVQVDFDTVYETPAISANLSAGLIGRVF
jgi:hypothetical protein